MKTISGFRIENKVDIIVKFILFIVSPLFGLIYSLKRIDTKSSFIVFFLFSLCFGMCFTPMKSSVYCDGQTYQMQFLSSIQLTKEEFTENFNEYKSFEQKKDFYADSLSFYVSRKTDNYHVFFLVASVIFSFFLLKSFKYLVTEKEFDNSYTSILLCYLFVYISIFNINGLRFWTGYWIAMFALFKIFRDNKYIYVLLLAVAGFCHGSLWILVALVLLAILSKMINNVWIVLYFISFFVGNIAFEAINNITDYIPGFMQGFIYSYANEDIMSREMTEGSGFWIIGKIFEYILDVFLFVIMTLIITNKRSILKDYRTKNIFTLLLVLMTFSNFVSTIPSLGTRFIIFTYPLIAYIWLLCIKDYKKNYSTFINFIPLYFFMNIYYTLQLYIETLNIDFFITSPLILMLKYL